MPELAQPAVAALVPDLFLAVPIADAVRAAGARPEMIDHAGALWPAIQRWPALVLIDLSVGDDALKSVRRAKALPHTRTIPIVAFGSHINTLALAAARAAGCDHAWARSRFVAELPALLRRVLNPPTRWVEGWDAPPPPLLAEGIILFNQGQYWECHEVLESLWRTEQRPIRDLYQGILQIGVAFHHLRAQNYAGAIKMLRRGLPRLSGLPATTQGVPIAQLAMQARGVHDQLVALGPERIGEFHLASLPHIELVPL